MFQVLLSHLRWIQCWCDDLYLSQSSSQHHGSPPPAITGKHQTNTNTEAAPHVPIPPQQQLCAALVAKRYTGGRLHGMFQELGWFLSARSLILWLLCVQQLLIIPVAAARPPVQRCPLVTIAAAVGDHFLALQIRTN